MAVFAMAADVALRLLPGDSYVVVPFWLLPVCLTGVIIYYPRRTYIGVSRWRVGSRNLVSQDCRIPGVWPEP